MLQGRQRVSSPLERQPYVSSPTEWLLDVLFRPERADTYPVFAIDNTDALSLVGKTEESIKINYPDTTRRVLALFGFVPSTFRRFSYNDLAPKLAEIDKAGAAGGADRGRDPVSIPEGHRRSPRTSYPVQPAQTVPGAAGQRQSTRRLHGLSERPGSRRRRNSRARAEAAIR
jgi:hypothetical protein